MTEPLITARNPLVRDWLADKGITGPYKPYVSPADVAHRKIYGNLPFWLAAFAESVTEVSIPNLSREDRERFNRAEMTIQELDAAGAHLLTYQVRAVTQ